MLSVMHQLWIHKYKPKLTKDVIGQERAVRQIQDFIANFKKQKKKAILAYGPSGCGKTASIYAIANESSLEVLEINASDTRNKDGIEKTLGNASCQLSLFSRGKLILVDEIDGVSGNEDRGGISAITEIIDKTSFPIIITADNPWDSKFSALRNKCVLVEFAVPEYTDIMQVLKNIASDEKINISDDALKSLARRSDGDFRAAINDLATMCNAKSKIEIGDLDELSTRNTLEDMPSALMKIFKTTDITLAINALENVDEELEKCALWIDENLPKEYEKPADLARAYDALSKADVFNRRIMRQQHWHFLVYISALLSAGVACAKDERYKKMVSYTPTSRILKIWRANMSNQKRNAIAAKIASHTHTSKKRALHDTLPYLQTIFQKSKSSSGILAKELDLDKEEIGWLKGK